MSWRSARPTLFREDMAALAVIPPRRLRRRGRVDPGRRRRDPAAARAGRGVRRRGRHLLLGAQRPAVRRRRQPRRRRPCSPCSPSAAATRTGPARSTRWTACSGRRPGRASRPGTRRPELPAAGPAGTSSAPRSRCDHLGDGVRRAGRRQRPGVPAPRDERLGGPGAHRPVAVRPALRARRDGRPGRREDVEVARQPGVRLDAAPRRAATRWRSGWRCSPTTTAATGPGPTPSSRRRRPGWPAGGRPSPGRPARRRDAVLDERPAAPGRRPGRPGALAVVDRWADAGADPRRRRRRRPALVARTVDALLGVRL